MAISPTAAHDKRIDLFYKHFDFMSRRSLPAQSQEIKILTAIKSDADAVCDIHKTCG
jgi:hypothetical protein